MANSKYSYVKDFELPDPLLPGTFMILRLDGHSFHRCVDEWPSCVTIKRRPNYTDFPKSIILQNQTIHARWN